MSPDWRHSGGMATERWRAELLNLLPAGAAEFSVESVSELAGMSASTVRGWCERGILRNTTREGRAYRIPRQSLVALIQNPPTPTSRHRIDAQAERLILEARQGAQAQQPASPPGREASAGASSAGPSPAGAQDPELLRRVARLTHEVDSLRAQVASLQSERDRWRRAAQRNDEAMERYRENWRDFSGED